jgi:nucleoside-diphosphate-sugar epimerase
MTPKALVTGSTGFIGHHLVESLLAQKWGVTCLIRPKSRTAILDSLPVKTVRSEIDDIFSLEKAVCGQDYVFHVAARIRSAPRQVYNRANLQFTTNLAQACLNKNPGLKRFVFISSIAAAGPSPPGQCLDENQRCTPTSEYGKSKLRAEKALCAIWDKLPVTVIRPPNVYGPGQLETELLIKIIKKRIVPLLNEETGTTSLIYIKDLVDGIIQAALSPRTINQIYYLTDGVFHPWKNIILTMKDHILGPSFFLPLPERIISLSAWFADRLNATGLFKIHFGRKIWRAMVLTDWLFSTDKAENDFGFRSSHSLRQGLKETVEYCK